MICTGMIKNARGKEQNIMLWKINCRLGNKKEKKMVILSIHKTIIARKTIRTTTTIIMIVNIIIYDKCKNVRTTAIFTRMTLKRKREVKIRQ